MGIIKLILGNILILDLLWGIIDLSYSTYRYAFTDTSPESFALFEHPGETIRFDPIRGYFLSRTPSRVARINHRKVEYEGSFRGAQGFADRDDFSLRRSTASERRIAVFGDSFSSATMEPLNSPNWPDRVKDLSDASDCRPLMLLNFSVDGGGLANWASILRNIVAKDRYEIDGLVFAVAWDDLDRKFAMFDQVGSHRFAHARSPAWDVGAQPKTRSEARALIEKDPNLASRYVLSPEEFDAFLAGHWWPREWHFRISARLGRLIAGPAGWPALRDDLEFEPGQVALMREIRQLANEHSWPIAVVQIPTRDVLLDPRSRFNVDRTREFSEMLGATFLDGREAFRGLSGQQIMDDWFPVDGHWNRGGSDQFAYFMAAQLQRWVAAGAGAK